MALRTNAAAVREKGGPFLAEPVERDELRDDEVLARMARSGTRL